MNEQKQKTITHVGMWLAAIVGTIFGLLLTIVGYLLDWGPGSGMEGAFWEVLLVGIPSFVIAAYVGQLVVKKLAKIVFAKQSSFFGITIRSFVIVLAGCIIAFIVGWEIGFFLGKVTGTIEGIEWVAVLVYTPLMSFIWGIPVSLVVAILYGVFVFFYVRAENK